MGIYVLGEFLIANVYGIPCLFSKILEPSLLKCYFGLTNSPNSSILEVGCIRGFGKPSGGAFEEFTTLPNNNSLNSTKQTPPMLWLENSPWFNPKLTISSSNLVLKEIGVPIWKPWSVVVIGQFWANYGLSRELK